MATKKVAVEIKKAKSKGVEVSAPKEKKVKEPKVKKSSAELVTFGIKATIPVMTFGNMQPEIVVKAKTLEEAMDLALPAIESIFAKYVEAPRDGSPRPNFISKANVTVTERLAGGSQGATSGATITPGQGIAKPTDDSRVSPIALENNAKLNPPVSTPAAEVIPTKSPAFQKAEGAIAAAKTLPALNMIEDQIQASTRIDASEKPELLTLVLKKRKEF